MPHGINKEKTPDKPKLRGILQSTQPALFKRIKVMEEKEWLGGCPSLKETVGIQWLKATTDDSEWDAFDLKQQSPTFLAIGMGFLEDNFSMDKGEGVVQDDSHKEHET